MASIQSNVDQRDGAAEKQQEERQNRRNDDVHGGSGQRDPQLLHRVARHLLQTRYPADREEGDVPSLNAVPAGGEGVAVLVHHNAREE